MESFKNYIEEKDKKIKNYVIKMDQEKNFFLLDSEGKEIKKSDNKKELLKYAKEQGYTVIYFNENRM
jgi:predicted phosphatase